MLAHALGGAERDSDVEKRALGVEVPVKLSFPSLSLLPV